MLWAALYYTCILVFTSRDKPKKSLFDRERRKDFNKRAFIYSNMLVNNGLEPSSGWKLTLTELLSSYRSCSWSFCCWSTHCNDSTDISSSCCFTCSFFQFLITQDSRCISYTCLTYLMLTTAGSVQTVFKQKRMSSDPRHCWPSCLCDFCISSCSETMMNVAKHRRSLLTFVMCNIICCPYLLLFVSPLHLNYERGDVFSHVPTPRANFQSLHVWVSWWASGRLIPKCNM